MPDGGTPAMQERHDHTTPVGAELLGRVMWLAFRSAAHRKLALADLEWSVLPAIQCRQYRLFTRSSGAPVAFASWALISPKVEARLAAVPGRIAAEDWQSGNRPWLVDLIAPFGGIQTVLLDLKDSVFGGGPVRTLRGGTVMGVGRS